MQKIRKFTLRLLMLPLVFIAMLLIGLALPFAACVYLIFKG